MTEGLHNPEEIMIRIGEDGRRITGRTEAEVQSICRTALAENQKSLIVFAPRHSFITRVEMTGDAGQLQCNPFLLTAPNVIRSALLPGAATALLSAACANEPTEELAHGLLAMLPWACTADRENAALVVVLMGESQLRWYVIRGKTN